MKTRSMLLFALLVAAGALAAETSSEHELGTRFDPDGFRARKAVIERELAIGERYKEIAQLTCPGWAGAVARAAFAASSRRS